MKIFISYSQEDKELAGNLKRSFEEYDNIVCFIAHDDIEPGSEWEKEILSNLASSNVFMPLQTENLKQSFWCQQEAGMAIAKKIKVVPLIPNHGGIDPIGFYARFQGFKIKTHDLRGSVKLWLINEGIIVRDDNHDEIEKRIIIFEASNSWAEAYTNIRSLMELEAKFSKADILRIAKIATENDQILSSFKAQPYIRKFFMNHASIIPKDQIEVVLK